jgi:hypothetical protein
VDLVEKHGRVLNVLERLRSHLGSAETAAEKPGEHRPPSLSNGVVSRTLKTERYAAISLAIWTLLLDCGERVAGQDFSPDSPPDYRLHGISPP